MVQQQNYGRSTYIAWAEKTFDLLEIDSGGLTATTDTIEVTRYGESVRRYIPGYTDYGSIAVTVSTERTPDVYDLRLAFTDRIIGTLSVVTPIGLQLSYEGFITSFSDYFDKNGLYTIKLVFKLITAPVHKTYADYVILPLNTTPLYRGCSYGLFLSPRGGNDTGGGSCTWAIISPRSSEFTEIVGNTLTIGSNEEKANITVQASLKPEQAISDVFTSTYDIVAPTVTSIQISGDDRLEFVKPGEGEDPYNISKTYTASVYPTGADQRVIWTISNEEGIVPPEELIQISDGGVVQVYGVEAMYLDSRQYVFLIKAISITANRVHGEKYITLTIKENDIQA